jgi:hypothetical protein
MDRPKIRHGVTLERCWKEDDLRAVWDFCQHDFDRFIALLGWIEEHFGK